MNIPQTYSEWCYLLEKFGQGDDMALEQLSNGVFAIDVGTASRFYSRVEEAYIARKKIWLEKFQRSFQLQRFKTEDDLGIALRDAKLNLIPISKFITIKGLPDDLRKTLNKDFENFVSDIRKSLKDNISKSGNRQERMLMTLNNFGPWESFQDILFPQNSATQETNNFIPATGRKIIF